MALEPNREMGRLSHLPSTKAKKTTPTPNDFSNLTGPGLRVASEHEEASRASEELSNIILRFFQVVYARKVGPGRWGGAKYQLTSSKIRGVHLRYSLERKHAWHLEANIAHWPYAWCYLIDPYQRSTSCATFKLGGWDPQRLCQLY